MELQQAISNRVSIRKFKNDKVDPALLKKMVEMAGKAPSINNSQPWEFLAVVNEKILGEMATTVKDKVAKFLPENHEKAAQVKTQVERFSTFFADAPAMIVVLQKPYEAVVDKILPDSGITPADINKMRNFPNIQTIGAAIQNMLLTAVDLGLGACWLTGPNIAAADLEKILGVEAPYTIAACVAVGYPEKDHTPGVKKPVDEIFRVIE